MAQRTLELVLKIVSQSSSEIQRLQAQLQQAFSNLNVGLNIGPSKFNQGIQGAKKEAEGLFDAITSASNPVTALSFGFNQVTEAIGKITGVVQQVGGAINSTLLQPVEKFNAQILSSQTNLAAAVKIFQNGVEVIDPTKKIQATRDTIESLLKQVERDTESLVGVTSEQVFGITDILLRNSAQIQGQFDQTKTTFKDSLAALTKGFAAELKVSGIGFFQASQEISSIFRGDITQDSLIAKKLGLDNAQINKLKSQGKLVEELVTRLQTSVAGNAIAATTSLSGPLSNIQDFFQRLAREAGKPLFQPLVEGLNNLYNTFKQFEPQIFGPITQITQTVGKTLGDFIKNFGLGFQQVLQQFKPAIDAFKGTFDALGQTLEKYIGNYGPQIARSFQAVGTAAAGLANILGVVLGNSLTVVIKLFDQIVNSPVTVFLADKISGAVSAVVKSIGDLGNIGADLANKFGQGFIAVLDATEKIRNGLTPILILATEIGQGIIESLAPVTPALQPLIAGFEGLKAVVGPVGELFQKSFQGIGDFAKNAFKEALSSVDGFAARVKDTVRAIIDNPAFQAVARVLKININDIKAQLDQLDARTAQAKESAKITKQGVAQEGKKGDDNITFQSNQVEKLGTAYQQLQKEADSAFRTLRSGGTKGMEPEFQKAGQTAIKNTQTQLELGRLTSKQAEERLKEVLTFTGLEKDVVLQAVDAITKVRKQSLDQQIKDLDIQSQSIANAVKRGQKTELQGAEETTKLKQQQIQLQLADTQKGIEAEERAIKAGAGSATRLNTLKQQQKALNEGLEKEQIEGAERIQKARFDSIQKAEDKATRIAKESETQRQIEIQKLVNGGVIRREEADQRRLNSVRKTIETELAAEQESLKKLQAIPKSSDPALEKDRQKQIQDSRQRTSDLSLKLLENEKQQQEAVTAAIQARIDQQLKAEQNALTAQKLPLDALLQANEAIAKSIESRQSLLKAEQDIIRANAELTQANYSNAIKLLESANSEEERLRSQQEQRQNLAKRLSSAKSPEETASALKEFAANERRLKQEQEVKNLKIEAARANVAAIEQQNALEQQSLQLEQEKTKILQEQEKLRLSIATIEAESALASAEAERAKVNARKDATAEEKRAADLSVRAAQKRLDGSIKAEGLFAESQKNQAAIFAAQNRQQQVQQGVRLNAARADLAALTPGSADDRALAQQNIGFARNAAQLSTSSIQNQVQDAQGTPLAQQQNQPVVTLAQQAGNIIPQILFTLNEMKGVLLETMKAKFVQVNLNQKIEGNKLDPSTIANLATKQTIQGLTGALKAV